MKRKVGYTWKLREVMAPHGIFTTTELVPMLRDRGIELSASQIHRLVSGTPKRLSLQVLAAFCDIFACTRPTWSRQPLRTPESVRLRLVTFRPCRRRSRNCDPGRPGFCLTREPDLHPGRVRALAQEDLRPLPTARLVRCPLA